MPSPPPHGPPVYGHSQDHELGLIAHHGVFLLHQLEPLLHQPGVILLAHACGERGLSGAGRTAAHPSSRSVTLGQMCKESRAGCCRNTPKPGCLPAAVIGVPPRPPGTMGGLRFPLVLPRPGPHPLATWSLLVWPSFLSGFPLLCVKCFVLLFSFFHSFNIYLVLALYYQQACFEETSLMMKEHVNLYTTLCLL